MILNCLPNLLEPIQRELACFAVLKPQLVRNKLTKVALEN